MQKLPFIATLLLLMALRPSAMAQVIPERDNEVDGYEHFYEKVILRHQRPIEYAFVRENDVIWETSIWRTVDLRIKFNQYFYYPLRPDGVHGRKNFAYMVWDAIRNDEIQIYKDDECKIPIDNAFFVNKMTKGDTLQLEIIDEDENYEYKTVIVPHDFSSENILQIHLKEAWYIDKVTTRQWVRYLSLAVVQNKFKQVGDEQINIGMVPLFWMPMLSPAVQRMLQQHEAYYEDNIAHLPSWQYLLEARRYESFVTRESNRFNRTIMSYLTGEDALLEAEKIENKLMEISQDMWEW